MAVPVTPPDITNTSSASASVGEQKSGGIALSIGGINSPSAQRTLALAIVAAAALLAWVLVKKKVL